jgi:excisionase family DNA binding protein
MFEMQNDILTVEEMMEVLYIGRNYAYKLLNSGDIKAFKVGKSWRIPKKSLEEYILNKCKSRVTT